MALGPDPEGDITVDWIQPPPVGAVPNPSVPGTPAQTPCSAAALLGGEGVIFIIQRKCFYSGFYKGLWRSRVIGSLPSPFGFSFY